MAKKYLSTVMLFFASVILSSWFNKTNISLNTAINSFKHDTVVPVENTLTMQKFLAFQERLRNEFVGTNFPNICFYDYKQKRNRNIAELKGKAMFIDFWFTTCPPCVKIIPTLNKIMREIKQKDTTMQFWAFTFNKEEIINDFLKENKFDFDIGIIERDTIDKYRLSIGYPSYYLIDFENRITDFTKNGAYDSITNSYKMGITFDSINKKYFFIQ